MKGKTVRHLLYRWRRMFIPIYRTMYVHQMLKENSDNALVCVELGVSQGNNAEIMLKNLNIKKLYLVDSYDGNPNTDYVDAKKRLKKFEDKIKWIITDSINATNFVPDGLDYIYYDIGRLTYDDLVGNLDVWIPKLKVGGFISGRGFRMSNYDEACAVVDYARCHPNLMLSGVAFEWWFKRVK